MRIQVADVISGTSDGGGISVVIRAFVVASLAAPSIELALGGDNAIDISPCEVREALSKDLGALAKAK